MQTSWNGPYLDAFHLFPARIYDQQIQNNTSSEKTNTWCNLPVRSITIFSILIFCVDFVLFVFYRFTIDRKKEIERLLKKK